ncbi:MAG: 2,3-bisphosphoglycerate-independent phosphoglycerate mutase [Oscillospiraceae bacterium]|jgi:2,3-bisphosphoglycerate-independent phosphoglycerate mutase|nr:2,3-bisphosphoglycerate-independent phosphoglycerate mutase [Oscillospiraceae bacterium]
MKYLILIGDGMADHAQTSIGGKTPLEAANKPDMDYIASRGTIGRSVNCPAPLAPGSDTAILSIFGCDPAKYYFGRAPLEAAAQGITVPPGALAFRCNMASISTEPEAFGLHTMKSHSAGGIDGAASRKLVTDLFANPEFASFAEKCGVSVYPTDSYRHICVCDKPLETDYGKLKFYPPHDNLGAALKDILPNDKILTALMEQSYTFLSRHPINLERETRGELPANCIWFWASGTSAKLPDFYERYGKRGSVISAVPLCHGIGILQGLKVISVPGATGELDTNYGGKAEAALKAFDEGDDFICLHVEAPDECTHNSDLPGKIQAIENIDSLVLAPLLDGFKTRGEDFRLLLISDHYTLSENGQHDATPVPYVIYSNNNEQISNIRDDGLPIRYTERDFSGAPLTEDGCKLIERLFKP